MNFKWNQQELNPKIIFKFAILQQIMASVTAIFSIQEIKKCFYRVK